MILTSDLFGSARRAARALAVYRNRHPEAKVWM